VEADAQIRDRRARLVTRHRLDGSAPDAVEAARSVVVLHATDPAGVFIAALARSAGASLASVAATMYDEHRLLRMLAMRRTLFVVPRELVPTVHHAASLDVAAAARRRLLAELAKAPTEPPLPTDPADLERWLVETEDAVEGAVAALGTASGAQLARAEPRLRTVVVPRTEKHYDIRRAVTSQVLVLMGADGRLVRHRPLGSWTSRQHTWAAITAFWPGGLPSLDRDQARSDLVGAYLRRFGPATERDVAWWTGWPLGVTRAALSRLDTVSVPAGLVLGGDEEPVAEPPPVAALLPALDPTPMGWKDRAWFLPGDPRPLYDAYGNIGPTVWWRGEVVGGWAVRGDGSIATHLLSDRGVEAAEAVAAAAARLEPRLEGAVVVPSFRTPLERRLSSEAS
jgi:hypothetical protein